MTERELIQAYVNKSFNHLITVILYSLHHQATEKEVINLMAETLTKASELGTWFDNRILSYYIDPQGQDKYKTDRWSPRTIKEHVYTYTPFFNRKATESSRHPYECDRKKGIHKLQHKLQHAYMMECYLIYSYALLSQEQED